VSLSLIAAALAAALLALSPGRPAADDRDDAALVRGAEAFRACSACHSLQPGRQLTGPSLHGIWQRRAGTVSGFARYSEAMRQAQVTWDERTLDAWLKDSQALIPGNEMTFPGIPAEADRRDLIAFLRAVGLAAARAPAPAPSPGRPGDPEDPGGPMRHLRSARADEIVARITYCGDAYRVTTAAGRTRVLWEFNVRFKTDGSADGPAPGRPVLLAAGMRGDRVYVVFADPDEISRTVRKQC
jgi:cytochrome c